MIRMSRRGAICACLCCFSAALAFGPAGAAQSPRPEFTFSELRPGVFVHTSWSTLANGQWFPSNGLVVVGADRTLMIDTAWTNDQTELLLDRLEPHVQGRPIDLFVTHFHRDRMGGIGVTASRNIVSYAFARTVEEARRHDMGRIDRALAPDSRLFDLGGRQLEAFYPGPGHTVDNAVVMDRASGVLFGGCMMRALAADDLGNVADADVAHWGASTAGAAERFPKATLVVPGHGAPGNRDVFAHTIALARS